jgi:hypothetical protein
MRKAGKLILIAAAATVVLLGVLLSQPISRTKDTPLMRRLSRLHEIGTKLRYYADEHSVFPDGGTINSNIDALVTIGILSAEDGAYLQTNQIEYRGFDLRHVASDVAVFECAWSNTRTPCKIVAYSDGHVAIPGFHRRQ